MPSRQRRKVATGDGDRCNPFRIVCAATASRRWKPGVPDNGFDGRTRPIRQDVASDSHTASIFIGQSLPTGTEADGNGGNPPESGSNIVQVTIEALMELCVQPHQAKMSSGGGGGGNESGWDDNDNEKDKLKPRRRRR